MLLNKPAYSMEKDNLIYDMSHPIDAKAVTLKVNASGTTAKDGEVKRGQVLDVDDGIYTVHATGGDASCIVAKDASYAADDTGITVSVYISGAFTGDALVASPALGAEDIENLRSKGIFVK